MQRMIKKKTRQDGYLINEDTVFFHIELPTDKYIWIVV